MARTKSRVRNRVRELRTVRIGMTQQHLARALGVTRQTVIAIEQGKFCPSLESALRLAKVFQLPVDEIFELEEDLGHGRDAPIGHARLSQSRVDH